MSVVDLSAWRQQRHQQGAATPQIDPEAQSLSPELELLAGNDHEVREAGEYLRRMLARSDRSEAELRAALRANDFSDAAIDQAITDACDMGYLDDLRFAEHLIETRLSRKGLGTRGIAQELKVRGIPEQIIQEVLSRRNDDDESDLAVDLARDRVRRFVGLESHVAERRLRGFLERRGFGQQAIRNALEVVKAPTNR